MAITRERQHRRRLLPNAFVAAVKRLARRAAGVGMGLAACAAWASLATWSIHDPSLNNATHGAPANVLGHAGAGMADLTIQSLGLAAIVLFLPLAAWGWHLMTMERPRRAFYRLLMWPSAVLLVAGALAALPVPRAWPLPNGFGGIMGDLAMASFRYGVAFMPDMLVSLAGFLVLMGAGVPALLYACGIPLSALTLLWKSDREGSSGVVAILIGLPLHLAMRIRALLTRALRRRRRKAADSQVAYARGRGVPAPSQSHYPEHKTPAVEVHPDGRIEPFFGEFAAGEACDVYDEHYGFDPQNDADEDARALCISRARGTVRAAQLADRAMEDYALPDVRLLKKPPASARAPGIADAILEENARLLEGVLEDFGVKGEIINVRPGPVVTLYELEPAPGTKSSRVIGLADDIARSMSAVACRVAVVPGRNAIGIELPNERREMVFLRELLESEDFQESEATLALALGKNIGGEPVTVDLARMPHLLIAGTTGSGKSVGINTMILSLLYRLSPDECKFIMIDPKMLELSVYDGIPHLLAPVVTDPRKAIVALKWTVREMEERYKRMSKLGVRNIEGYNVRLEEAEERGEVLTRTVQTGFDRATGQPVYEQEEMDYDPMPYIVVIVDEMADLMMVAGKDIEGAVQRLAQMARAAGIHMITATQRPSVDVITGTIKANFPTRVSFQVTSKIDSRTILGEQGAEQLLGQGDMLYMAGGGRIMRVHGPFVSDDEVEKVVRHLKRQGVPDYLDAVTEETETEDEDPDGEVAEEEGDDLFNQAVQVVLRDGKASTSYVQRRLGIGYNRAATLIERMEEEGIISPANHAGKREILAGEGRY